MSSGVLYNEDIMDVLKRLPDGSVDMVFGDPDYNVGINYGGKDFTKPFDEYVDWYIGVMRESMRVLKDTGNCFMINYPKQNAHLRVKYLDDEYPLTHDYVWVYNTNIGVSPNKFTTAHRSILHTRKTKDNNFYKDNVSEPYKNPNDRRIKEYVRRTGSTGRMPYSWFEYNQVKNVSREKTDHPCQIPKELSRMLICSCTKEGDTVLILFAGSGAEIDVCKDCDRNFISAEINEDYCRSITEKHNMWTGENYMDSPEFDEDILRAVKKGAEDQDRKMKEWGVEWGEIPK